MINKIKRILAALIDFFIICFLCTMSVGILTLGELTATPLSIVVYTVLYVVFLLTKDLIFKSASIGKRIFKLEVIKIDGTKLRAVDVIKRNVTVIFLLPLEELLIMANDRRIGDIWAKTSVVHNASKRKK